MVGPLVRFKVCLLIKGYWSPWEEIMARTREGLGIHFSIGGLGLDGMHSET